MYKDYSSDYTHQQNRMRKKEEGKLSFVCRWVSGALGIVILLGIGWNDSWAKSHAETDRLISQYSDPFKLRTQLSEHPESTDEILRKITTALVDTINDPWIYPWRLRRSDELFSEIEYDLNPQNNGLSAAEANQASDTLLELYDSKRDRLPDGGTKIVRFVSKFGETPRTKSFILDALRHNDPGHGARREQVTVGLYWGRTFRHDPEIASALEELSIHPATGMPPDFEYTALAALSKVDIDRAAPILREKIVHAQNLHEFVKTSMTISTSHRDDLLEVLFKSLKHPPQKRDTVPGPYSSPYTGIEADSIIEYAAHVEDEKLETALDVLYQDGGNPPHSLPVLAEKLKSKSVRSRRAVLDYISREARRGAFIRNNVIEMLKNYSKTETDLETAKKAEAIANEIQRKHSNKCESVPVCL